MSEHKQFPDIQDLELYADTDKQRQYLAVVQKLGNVSKAASEIGIGYRTLQSMLARLRIIRDACDVGAEPPDGRYLPPGHKLAGLSTMVMTDEGHPQWIKTREDKVALEEELQDMREAFTDSLPRVKAVKPTKTTKNADLLNLFILTDYHIGMKSWREETGGDWDTKIAEQLIYDWFSLAVKKAPLAGTAILGQLGDFLHYDGIDPVTPISGHLLDADTRFQKLIRVAIRVVRRIVRELLKRHDHVHIIMAEGNHDITSSMWLREVFYAWYENEPRVTVDRSADPYYCFEFGKVSLFFHHGHKRKPTNVDDVFVAKFRPVFGRTEFSYGHMGHLHHDKQLETVLMHIEQHQTLAVPDAYASRGGWNSGRSARFITYHKDYGEVSRGSVTPEML